MNIYVIVEGVTETKVYPEWIKYTNSSLTRANYIDEVTSNNYYLVSGNGYPYIFNIIDNAILDTNEHDQFDRLVIAIDSESLTLTQRYQEIENYVLAQNPRVEIKIIVQHFCFETWALGNERQGPRNPKSNELKYFKSIYDVTKDNPDDLPDMPSLDLNRAQFAYEYLKLAIRDKGTHLTYGKNRPEVVMHQKFYDAVKSRMINTQHIMSFNSFLEAFV